MRFDAVNLVTFDTDKDWYYIQEIGDMPFTIQTLRQSDYDLVNCCDYIQITNRTTRESFIKLVTAIRDITPKLGVTLEDDRKIVLIQWTV